MPNVTTSGTLTKTSAGCHLLRSSMRQRVFHFAGTAVGSSCTIQYTDDSGTDRVIAGGTVTVLPTSVLIKTNMDLKIVTTGSPDFNVTMTLTE